MRSRARSSASSSTDATAATARSAQVWDSRSSGTSPRRWAATSTWEALQVQVPRSRFNSLFRKPRADLERAGSSDPCGTFYTCLPSDDVTLRTVHVAQTRGWNNERVKYLRTGGRHE